MTPLPLSATDERLLREALDAGEGSVLVRRLLATLDFERARGQSVARETVAREIMLAAADGAAARDVGKPRTQNPYVADDICAKTWEYGWEWSDARHERDAIAKAIVDAEQAGFDARMAGEPQSNNFHVNDIYHAAWERGWQWAESVYECRETARRPVPHVTEVCFIPSVSGVGTTRQARCTKCTWRGTERGSMQLAAEDALWHERKPVI